MATFDQFVTSLEAEFGETGKGKPFEVFCKWFLENDPEWSKPPISHECFISNKTHAVS
ncbi:MAG: hypothetical protein P8L68_05940 [Paracoccaceae bacterium]|nr:hypothetical protein [Paracoccaceae bacterium]MDG2258017.1 hypothetical protein [Paracoccaceae bacterium]